MREDCGLIPYAGTDLEGHVIRLQLKQIGHERDDKGLRDSLAVADRQWRAEIGISLQLQGHEFVSRDLAHHLDYPGAKRRFAELRRKEYGIGNDLSDHLPAHQIMVLVFHRTVLLCLRELGRMTSHRSLDRFEGLRLPRQCKEGFFRRSCRSAEDTRTRDTEPLRTRVIGTSTPAAPVLQIFRNTSASPLTRPPATSITMSPTCTPARSAGAPPARPETTTCPLTSVA